MRKPSRKTIVVVAVVLLVLWGSFLLLINWAMRQPPETFGRVMMHVPMPGFFVLPFETLWNQARVGTVQVGDAAPDFRLPTVDHKEQVELTALRGKPVALVFGSYT